LQYISYTGLKVVYDQQIQEALEHHHFSGGQETQTPDLLQTFGPFLARFITFVAPKPEATTPLCNREVKGTVC